MYQFTIPGKRQAKVVLDAPTQAACAGQPCDDGEVFCPRHHVFAYPDVVAKHRADVAA